MTTVKNVYDYINSIAPFEKQEDWDNSGLLVGDLRKSIETCIVALDITKEVIDLAKKSNAQLIISHHPVIFSPITHVMKNSLVFDLIENDISAICAHTNYDIAQGGINDALTSLLKLEDIVSNENGSLRYGRLKTPMKCDELSHYIKYALGCDYVRYTKSTSLISRIGICGGSGASLINEATQNSDAFLTGEASYHDLLDAQQNNYCIICAGHFESEIIGTKALFTKISNVFTDVKVIFANQINPIEVV